MKLYDYIGWMPAIPSSQIEEDDRRLAVITTIKAPAVAPLIRVEEVRSITERLRTISTLPLPILKIPRKRTPPDYMVWLVLAVASIVSVCATIYSFQHHDILLYGDDYTHMAISRSVIDSLTPGFGQIGGVWLPLPHLLMIPFIWNDYLWETGLAGSIPSMICYVVASLYLFLMARRVTKNNWASVAGTLVFMLNPNVIYLQTTPLSEPICFATFSITSYYFIVWAQEDRVRYLVVAAAGAFFATIARYDGWALFLSLFVLIIIIGMVRRHERSQIIANLIVFGLLGSLGIILWLTWNKVIFGDPLYFQHGIYSSQNQMQYYFGKQLADVRHNLFQSIRYYMFASLDTMGLVVFLLALISVGKLLTWRRDLTSRIASLSLLSPLAFYVFSFYSGQVVLTVPGVSSSLFNARFGTEAVLPAALFLATLANEWPKLPHWFIKGALPVVIGGIVIAQSIFIFQNGIISLEDGQYGASCQPTNQMNFYLAQHYNGGLILEDIYLGSPNEGAEVGIHLDHIIYQGSGPLWKNARRNPGAVVDWVLIGIRGKGSPYPEQVNTTSETFLSQFTLVAHNASYKLYLHKGLSPLPVHPLPTKLFVEHPYCGTHTIPPKGEW